MSDFLTRMVQRTLGLAPVIQPVIPSIFAPPAIGKDDSSRLSVLTDEAASGMVAGAGQGEHIKSGDSSMTAGNDSSDAARHTTEERSELLRADKNSDTRSLLIHQTENNTHIDQKENERPTPRQKESDYERKKLQTPGQQEIESPDRDDSPDGQKELPAPIPFLKKTDDFNSFEWRDEAHKKTQKEENAESRQGLPAGRDSERVIHEQKITVRHILSQKETDKNTREFNDGGDTSMPFGGPPSEYEENLGAEKKTNAFKPATVKRVMGPAVPFGRPGTGRPILNEPSENKPAETAPSIKVTIGRIDVRAVMQQTAQPKRRSPAGPKLSLDEYLKQRGGKRE